MCVLPSNDNPRDVRHRSPLPAMLRTGSVHHQPSMDMHMRTCRCSSAALAGSMWSIGPRCWKRPTIRRQGISTQGNVPNVVSAGEEKPLLIDVGEWWPGAHSSAQVCGCLMRYYLAAFDVFSGDAKVSTSVTGESIRHCLVQRIILDRREPTQSLGIVGVQRRDVHGHGVFRTVCSIVSGRRRTGCREGDDLQYDSGDQRCS
jgi:hypothetical protein